MLDALARPLHRQRLPSFTHWMTRSMRCLTRLAVSGFFVQIGYSASVITAPSIAEIGRVPNDG